MIFDKDLVILAKILLKGASPVIKYDHHDCWAVENIDFHYLFTGYHASQYKIIF